MGGEMRVIQAVFTVMDEDQRRANGKPERPEIDADRVRAEIVRVLDEALENWMKFGLPKGREGELPGIGLDYIFPYPDFF